MLKQLKATYENCMNDYKTHWGAFPWTNKNAYGQWLAQTYFYARHTTRIIALAGIHFDFTQQDLHNRFMQHTAEEKNHDLLLLKDLADLGFKIDQFHEFTTTSDLYQPQYYYGGHGRPSALFGYFLSLEGVAINCAGKALEIRKSTEMKTRATSFLRVHVEEDQDHVREAFSKVEKFNPEELATIEHALKQTTRTYCQMMKEMTSVIPAPLKKAG